MSINEKRVAAVADFIDKFEASTDPELWLKLCNEEANETIEALGNLLKETADLAYVLTGMFIACGKDAAKMEAKLKQMEHIDLVVNIIEDVLEGMPPQLFEEAYDEVHESNMSKLDTDGKPVKRSDGKILKGPNYKAPDMIALIKEYFGKNT